MTGLRFQFWIRCSGILCLQILLLCQANELRYKDESFPSEFKVFGRTVKCVNITQGLFPSKTWTCANITVDDCRVAYGYNFGSLGTGNCNETGGKHEFPALCREMLSAIGIDSDFWAVYFFPLQTTASAFIEKGFHAPMITIDDRFPKLHAIKTETKELYSQKKKLASIGGTWALDMDTFIPFSV